uniref:Uncharacterized protein n=1 Tax=Ananas comosus var. bracteatus TaxID=296719 RepID=A0A6V7PP54_ANACO|nr:unnamed protein product [Ananas comosus var. bracteatus]
MSSLRFHRCSRFANSPSERGVIGEKDLPTFVSAWRAEAASVNRGIGFRVVRWSRVNWVEPSGVRRRIPIASGGEQSERYRRWVVTIPKQLNCSLCLSIIVDRIAYCA